MANSISLQPLATTNAAGSFSVQSDGYVQGVALDDPSIRNSLAMGILASTETLPMWGGLPIFEHIPASTSNGALGGLVGRSTSYATVNGFAVFNQAQAFVTTPQSQAPSAGAGASIPFFRMGSRARIAVPIDATLAASLANGTTPIDQQVSWDFTLNEIIAFNTTALPVKIVGIVLSNNKVVTYDSVNNLVNWTVTGALAIIEI